MAHPSIRTLCGPRLGQVRERMVGSGDCEPDPSILNHVLLNAQNDSRMILFYLAMVAFTTDKSSPADIKGIPTVFLRVRKKALGGVEGQKNQDQFGTGINRLGRRHEKIHILADGVAIPNPMSPCLGCLAFERFRLFFKGNMQNDFGSQSLPGEGRLWLFL